MTQEAREGREEDVMQVQVSETKKGADAGTSTPKAQTHTRRHVKPERATTPPAEQDAVWLPLPLEGFEGYEVHRSWEAVRSWRQRGAHRDVRRAQPITLKVSGLHTVTLRIMRQTLVFPVALLQRAAGGSLEAIEELHAHWAARARKAGGGFEPGEREALEAAVDGGEEEAAAEVDTETEELKRRAADDEIVSASVARARAFMESARPVGLREGMTRAPDMGLELEALRERVGSLVLRVEQGFERLAFEVHAQMATLTAAVVDGAARGPASKVEAPAVSDGARVLRAAPPASMQHEQLLVLLGGLDLSVVAALLNEEPRTIKQVAAGTRAEFEAPSARRLDMVYVAYRAEALDGTDSVYDSIVARLDRVRARDKRGKSEEAAWQMRGEAF